MKVFFLEGSYYEMGKRWAEILKGSGNAKAAFDYYSKEPERVALHLSPHCSLRRFFLEKFFKIGLNAVSFKVRKEDKEFLKAFSDEFGVPYRRAVSTFCFPDFFNCLLAVANDLFDIAIPHIPISCSAFVVLPDVTKDRALFHGRNLDYGGGSFWEKGHSILVLKPKEGVASINVTTEGVYAPGITSINESGICVSLNLCFSRDVSLKGTPVLSIVSEIISKAKSLSDVHDILKRRRPFSGWALIVSSSKEKDAAVFELSSSRVDIVHPEGGILCYTNMYLSDEQKMREFAPSYVWVENDCARYERLKFLLFDGKGYWDERGLIKVLGDTYDPIIKKNMAFANTISTPVAISSALFSMDKDALWVADNPVPVNRGKFLRFSITQLFKGKAEPIEELQGNVLSPDKEKAFRFLVEANFLWESGTHMERIIYLLDRAIDEDGTEPLYFFVRALFLVKLGSFEDALKDLEMAFEGPLSPYKRRVLFLWRGRLNDLLGKRDEACFWYTKVVEEGASLDLQKKAWINIKRPYTKKDVKKLDIMPFLADFVDVL